MNKCFYAIACGLILLAAGCMTGAAPGGNGGGSSDGGQDNVNNNDNGADGSGGGGSSSSGEGGDSVNGLWRFDARLEPFDPQFEDLFGDSVAASDSTVLVGTGFKNALSGIVDVFVNFGGEWIFDQRLVGGDARFPEQNFGGAVAVGNNMAFVGASKFSIEGSFAIQTGAVYVFENLGPEWRQAQLLTVPDAEDFELIGSALAFESNQSRLVVGAPGRDSNQGAAYVFARSGAQFAQEARLQASDGINFEDFGAAVATENQTVIVGAPNQNFGTGAVYVFERDIDWSETQKILAPDGDRTDKFGQALALEGDTLVIAAPSNKRPQDDLLQAGAVYIYSQSGGSWQLQQTLVPDDDLAGLFGLALALEDGTLAITAGGNQQVLFYEEQNGVWTQVDLVEPQRDTFVLDSFGNAIALQEGTLVIGARSADAGSSRAAGAAFVYSRSDDDSSGPPPDGVRF